MRSSPILFALLVLTLSGCGGGGSSSSDSTPLPTESSLGRATVALAWLARDTRFVPLASNGVRVRLLRNGALAGERLLARAGNGGSVARAEFDGLAYGEYDAEVRTYPNADGTGIAQATGIVRITVGRTPATADVRLSTTAASLEILPVSVLKGGSAPVGVTARDASGSIVLLAAGDGKEAVTWSVDPLPGGFVAGVLSEISGPMATLTATHSGATKIRASVDLGGTPLVATGNLTVGAIDDGTATVTIR